MIDAEFPPKEWIDALAYSLALNEDALLELKKAEKFLGILNQQEEINNG